MTIVSTKAGFTRRATLPGRVEPPPNLRVRLALPIPLPSRRAVLVEGRIGEVYHRGFRREPARVDPVPTEKMMNEARFAAWLA